MKDPPAPLSLVCVQIFWLEELGEKKGHTKKHAGVFPKYTARHHCACLTQRFEIASRLGDFTIDCSITNVLRLHRVTSSQTKKLNTSSLKGTKLLNDDSKYFFQLCQVADDSHLVNLFRQY